VFKVVTLLVVVIIGLAAIAAWSTKRRHRKADERARDEPADAESPRSKHRNRTWDAAVAKARRFRR
jgi:hypothetical protein